MLVTCQRFGDWFLFGLVWQYSSIQKNIIKVGSKPWILTRSCLITLSLPFYTDPDSKRELNFCNGYLSLLYFCYLPISSCQSSVYINNKLDSFFNYLVTKVVPSIRMPNLKFTSLMFFTEY